MLKKLIIISLLFSVVFGIKIFNNKNNLEQKYINFNYPPSEDTYFEYHIDF